MALGRYLVGYCEKSWVDHGSVLWAVLELESEPAPRTLRARPPVGWSSKRKSLPQSPGRFPDVDATGKGVDAHSESQRHVLLLKLFN